MKTVSMSGSLRENVGKKDAKKNRREGKIPCVIYGGKEQVHFTVADKEFSKIIFTPEVFILKLNISGTEYTAILQDIQFHPVTDSVLHVDMLEVIPGKPVVIGLPVRFIGSAMGVLQGGKLRKKLNKLIVKGLIEDLPEYLEIDVSDLDLNSSVKVRDVSFANLEFLENEGSEIVGVKTARGAGMGEEEEEEEEVVEGTEDGEAPAEGEAKSDSEGGEKK